MLIENESQWKTEDLKRIVNRIEATEGFRWEGDVNSRTLLLFKTSRKKVKPSRYNDEEKELPPAAQLVSFGKEAARYDNTRVVLVRSIDALKADVLDRLANSDVQQDMSPADVLIVVKETAKAMGGWNTSDCDFSWAADVPMRISGPGKRSRLAKEREIAALRNQQERVRRGARNAIEDLEKQIQDIQAKLDK